MPLPRGPTKGGLTNMGQKSRRNRVEKARPDKRTINELIETYTGSGTAKQRSARRFGLDLLRSFLDGYAYEEK